MNRNRRDLNNYLLGAFTDDMPMNATNQSSFIDQLAEAIRSAVNAAKNNQGSGNANNNRDSSNNRQHTPEPPPAPSFRAKSPQRMRPNRGAAPMDIENESEIMSLSGSVVPMLENMQANNIGGNNMVGNNMFMNGFMPPNVPPPSNGMNPPAPYMYYPAPTGSNTTPSSAAPMVTQTSNQMFMDPTTMIAAMQQMQQNYANNFTPTLTNVEEQSMKAIATTSAANTVMKEPLRTQNCVLLPPSASEPPPTTRERPPGCRTIFVGSLPEYTTEDLIREVFETCGEISIIRASKKNFCHIRYRLEESVDRALRLSGYRMTINAKDGPSTNRLHVDYAQARDDLYEFECKQRQLQREQRHRDYPTKDEKRSESPPPIPHYNDHEAAVVAEYLRNNETFLKALQRVAVWLERGDCTKRNANAFYSMIQSTHAHVRRLYVDKQQLNDDLSKAREHYRKQMQSMTKQFTQIEKVFSAASHKKVWDHFSKAQRKNIDQWKKLALELSFIQIEDDEMDMSDDERNHQNFSSKRMRYDAEGLREENDSLRCQLEALRNEMSYGRGDIRNDSDNREKQIKVLQETIRNMQTQLLKTKTREENDLKLIEQFQRKLKESNVKQLLLKTKIQQLHNKRRERRSSSTHSERSETSSYDRRRYDSDDDDDEVKINKETRNRPEKSNRGIVQTTNTSGIQKNNQQVIDIDDDVNIIEDKNCEIVEINDEDEDEPPQENVTEDENANKELEENKNENENTIENDKENENVNKNDERVQVLEKTKNVVEAKLSDEGKAVAASSNDEKSCYVPVETNLMEGSTEIEPKFLPFVEAKIIALTAAYLLVQPFGMQTESICAYLKQSMQTLNLQTFTLDHILGTYKNLFKLEKAETNELNNESKALWKFCGFKTFDEESFLKNGQNEWHENEWHKDEWNKNELYGKEL